MRTVACVRWSVVGALVFAIASACLLGCSIPNLDQPECTESRDTVREFYSWYLATDAEKREKAPDMFEKYVASDTFASADGTSDRFFLTNDSPKAFRVGECKVVEPGKRTTFEVLLFWKDDTRSEQRSIHVETEKRQSKWLITKVSK
jgi:predicted Fe-S protein YdhL (DUF1289 family)